MATDGPTPPNCDEKIFQHGECVFMTHSIRSNAMEHFVKQIAERSGQRVDWHFAGGRAVVLALGDTARVRDTIEQMMPEHDALQQSEIIESRKETDAIYEKMRQNEAARKARELTEA
jgi:hypothetical protein